MIPPGTSRQPGRRTVARLPSFAQMAPASGQVLLISPAGGPDQEVVETRGTLVAWSADSRTLAFIDREAEEVHSIFLVPASGGPKRQVTFPAAEKTYGDSSPAISPDGRTLAFVATNGTTRVKVNGTAQPTVVEGISEASSPAISSTRPGSDSRLVYQALTGRDNILESRHVDRERESISQAQKIGPSRAVDRVMDGSA